MGLDTSEVRELVSTIGRHRVLDVLEIHRSTLARWLSGHWRVPLAAAIVLRVLAEGRIPGMSTDWIGFRFDGDRLHCPNRASYTAREIMGWSYQVAAYEALEAKCARLERELVAAVKAAPRETANDAYTSPQDVRRRAYE